MRYFTIIKAVRGLVLASVLLGVMVVPRPASASLSATPSIECNVPEGCRCVCVASNPGKCSCLCICF
jgi:hypothetical protein